MATPRKIETARFYPLVFDLNVTLLHHLTGNCVYLLIIIRMYTQCNVYIYIYIRVCVLKVWIYTMYDCLLKGHCNILIMVCIIPFELGENAANTWRPGSGRGHQYPAEFRAAQSACRGCGGGPNPICEGQGGD